MSTFFTLPGLVRRTNWQHASNSPSVQKGIRALAWFVLVGWAIYPIGYMAMPGGWLSGMLKPTDINLFYNIADAINKIGFGLVVYGYCYF